MTQDLLEHISDYKREKKMTGKSKHGFTKGKSHLSNLIAYYDEMMVFVDEERTKNLIYLDYLPWLTLKKAFDIVFYSILVQVHSWIG